MKNKTMKKLKLCVFGLLLTVVSYGQSGILSPSDEFCTITDTIYYSSTDLDSVLSWYLYDVTTDEGDWEWTISYGESVNILNVVNNVILFHPDFSDINPEYWFELHNIKRTLCHRIINGDSTLTY